MANFMEAMKQTSDNNNLSITENGAVGYSTTGKELVDINFIGTSMRKESEYQIEDRFSRAYYEDPYYAVLWLFYLRDCRGGMGERRSFRICFDWLIENKPKVAKAVLRFIPEYGRYDDLTRLIDSDIDDEVVSMIERQLETDLSMMREDQPISLLAKYMPSENATSVDTKHLAVNMAKN